MTGNWVVGENGWRFHKSTGEYAANTWGWINGQYYYFEEAFEDVFILNQRADAIAFHVTEVAE